MTNDVVKDKLHSFAAIFTGLPGVMVFCAALVVIAIVSSRS